MQYDFSEFFPQLNMHQLGLFTVYPKLLIISLISLLIKLQSKIISYQTVIIPIFVVKINLLNNFIMNFRIFKISYGL